jgi:hypothetical protein
MVLVRVCDGAALQRVHRLEGSLHRLGHPFEKDILEPHPADIQRQPERRNPALVLLKPFPQAFRGHRCSVLGCASTSSVTLQSVT